jgi:hypothetical protein
VPAFLIFLKKLYSKLSQIIIYLPQNFSIRKSFHPSGKGDEDDDYCKGNAASQCGNLKWRRP